MLTGVMTSPLSATSKAGVTGSLLVTCNVAEYEPSVDAAYCTIRVTPWFSARELGTEPITEKEPTAGVEIDTARLVKVASPRLVSRIVR